MNERLKQLPPSSSIGVPLSSYAIIVSFFQFSNFSCVNVLIFPVFHFFN